MRSKSLVVLYLSALFCFTMACLQQVAVAAPNGSQEVGEHVLPLDDVRRFTTTIGHIKNYYVEPVEDKKIFEQAIRGMLEGLDPHSTYLSEKDFKDLRTHTSGEFGGLGLEVSSEDGYVKVVSPIDDTPASRAGIKAGDMIVRIDGKPIRNMSLKAAVAKMRGKKGSKITLTILRKGAEKPLEKVLTRAVIKVASVKSRLLEPGFGYVRLSIFQVPSGPDVYKAIRKLKKEAKGKLNGVILDLRNNPGGLLDAAIEVSDTFIDSRKLGKNKLLVYTEGRIPGAQIKAKATAGDALDGVPLIVLINEGSASASEIVAGALQDHRRAIIVGKRSFGKGSVQTVLPLDENSAVKLTTARYYTPKGRSIQGTGIKPDIKVDELIIPFDKHDEKVLLGRVKEADLEHHLVGENEKKEANKVEEKAATGRDGKPLINSDYQLYQALQLLKGMHVVKAR